MLKPNLFNDFLLTATRPFIVMGFSLFTKANKLTMMIKKELTRIDRQYRNLRHVLFFA